MARSVEEIKAEMNERKRLLAQLGSGKVEGRVNFVRRERQSKKKIEAAAEAATLYFHGCEDCEFEVEARSVKILVHECQRTILHIKAPILTHCVEVWRCEQVTVDFSVEVRTLQLDTSDGLNVHFSHKDLMGTTVWTGVEDLQMTFGDDKEARLSSGFSVVQKEDDTVEKEVSQFYVRFIEGKLLQEKVFRLKNGFPTTKREADSYDREQAKAALAKEMYVRGLMKFAERKLELKDERRAPPGGRNDPCHCGSGKKRKKCCGDWKQGAQVDPQPELRTLEELERSNAVDPAALLRRAREGDHDERALPVDDLAINQTYISGHAMGRAAPGSLVRVTIDGVPVGTPAVVNEDGTWRCDGVAPLQAGKIVEARKYDPAVEGAASGVDGLGLADADDDPLKGLTLPKKMPLLALGK